MAKKRVSRKLKVSQSSFLGNTDKLLIITISLLSALLILNVVTLTGFSTRFGTDYANNYYGENACERVGGIILREGVSANHDGKAVMLKATSDYGVSVEVDRDAKTIRPGHKIWINGVYVTNFVSNDNDACLILG